jgi:AMMECR1 domain-containing protein
MNNNINSCLAINGCYAFLNLSDVDSSSSNYLNLKYKHNKNTFGLFVTVERVIHKSNSYPHEVHGCLGYYDKYPFKPINKQLVYLKLLELGSNSVYSDSRKSYFPELALDYLANFKVSLMQLPLINIDNMSGVLLNHKILGTTTLPRNNTTITLNNINTKTSKRNNLKTKKNNNREMFNNNKYGLLTVSNGNTATYLPGVFENSIWAKVTSDLLNKAGITNNNVKFYAYTTLTSNCSLIDFFTYKVVLSLKYLEHVITLSSLFRNDNLPVYEITPNIPSKGSEYVYNTNEYVRNSGICSDIIKAIYFIYTNIDIDFLSSYNNILNDCLYKAMSYLLNVWSIYTNSNYDISYLQAVSFVIVGFCYYLNIIDTMHYVSDTFNSSKLKISQEELKQYITEYCIAVINNKYKLESNFEYGECGVALFTASDKFKYYKTIGNNTSNQYKFIIPNNFNIDDNLKLDFVFKINWLIQLLVLIDNKYYLTVNKSKYSILLKKIVVSLIKVLDIYYLTNIQQINKSHIIKLETNYIAVAYEACMNLYLSYSKFTILDNKQQNAIKKYIVLLSIELISRVNYSSITKSLYNFKSGSARLDITGHTIVC